MIKEMRRVLGLLGISVLLLGASLTVSATPYPQSGQATIGNYQINYGSVYLTTRAQGYTIVNGSANVTAYCMLYFEDGTPATGNRIDAICQAVSYVNVPSGSEPRYVLTAHSATYGGETWYGGSQIEVN